jgi:DNA repair protein RecO (recombination protein O)
MAMDHFTSPAIVLRRREYGDFDLIVTAITRDYGKCTLIAKSAKKSVKRFPGGTLDPFSAVRLVYHQGRGKGLFILDEATIEKAYGAIRTDIVKTAYASYWAELIALWLESGPMHAEVFTLLDFALEQLDRCLGSVQLLHILFQMRFLGQEGFRPVLERCTTCQTDIDAITQHLFCIDLHQGGVVCGQCPTPQRDALRLSRGTLKQLQWMASEDFSVARRVRFSAQAIYEATAFLESFVPYHIGKVPHSLIFLQKLRSAPTSQ